jgi:hypothetical protein
MTFDGKRSRPGGGDGGGGRSSGVSVPGKRTLTENLHAPVQRKRSTETPETPRHSAPSTTGNGSPLPAPLQTQMETAFSADFSAVRIHEDDQASAAGARAFARGTDLHFAAGQYDPHSEGGQTLIGHELAHVVQQAEGRVATTAQAKGLGVNDDTGFEAEADDLGARAARGEHVRTGDVIAPGGGAAQRHVVQRDPDPSADPVTAIHDAFHGSWFSEDEGAAMAQIRGRSREELRDILRRYRGRFGRKLEEEFRSYCDAGQAAEARRVLWQAMSVVERLESNLSTFDDNEDGMMDVIRTATRAELDEAGRDPQLYGLLDQLSLEQQYQARKSIWPSRTREHVLWRLRSADGILTDEDAVYSAILDLSPAERHDLWEQRASLLSFLDEGELAAVRRMCVGSDGGPATEAAALAERMSLATAGAGTDDDAVALIVGRVSSLREEEQRIQATLDTGTAATGAPLSGEERARLQARLREIGGIDATLLAQRRDGDGELEEDSFLGRLHGDVGSEEFAGMAGAMSGDSYAVAKLRLLDAIGIDDDEEAIYRVFRDLRGTVSLPEGRTASDISPDELARLQADATRQLRSQLRNDPDLSSVWSSLDDSERGILDHYVAGDTYEMALHELEVAYHSLDTDEAGILRVVARMNDADRRRIWSERPRVLHEILHGGWLAPREQELFREVLETGRLPTDQALAVAMGGWGDGTDEAMILDTLGAMSEAERRTYRLGYWLHHQNACPEGEVMQHALTQFQDLYERLRAELEDDELDAAMDRMIGVPSPEDFLTPEGRRMAAEIMSHRQRERMELTAGLTSTFSSTDDTAQQASTIYEAHLQQLVARGGDISLEDFSVLVGLDAQFNSRFTDLQAAASLISSIAGTVAATVAAVVIIVLSEGTLAPAAAELIAANGGAVLWGAITGGAARVAASEAFGGDFYDATSTDGARDAMIGAIEGATAVAMATLAARAASLVGLSQRALNTAIVRASVDSASSGLSAAGRGAATGALEGAIDGFVSGAIGDLLVTATDADTWRRSVWEVLGRFGMSFLRGGAFGMAAGGVTGGGLGGAFAFARVRGLQGAARRVADQFDGAVVEHGGAAAVPASTIDDITGTLPEAGIDPTDRIPGIKRYLAGQLNLDSGTLEIRPMSGGLSGALVYRVLQDNQIIGFFKIFRSQAEMLREISSLRRLADLELELLEPVGMVALGRDGAAGVGFMRGAEGNFVSRSIEGIRDLRGPARIEALARLRRDAEHVARALAELHDTTASGTFVSEAFKQSQVASLQSKWDGLVQRRLVGGDTLAIPEGLADEIGDALPLLKREFAEAQIPATMAHGDANCANFAVAADGHVQTIDVETMWRSVDTTGQGIAPQATDAGRFAEWLVAQGAPGNLDPAEAEAVQRAFLDAYRAASRTAQGSSASFETALRFYQVNFDMIRLSTEITDAAAGFSPATSPALQQLLANMRRQ